DGELARVPAVRAALQDLAHPVVADHPLAAAAGVEGSGVADLTLEVLVRRDGAALQQPLGEETGNLVADLKVLPRTAWARGAVHADDLDFVLVSLQGPPETSAGPVGVEHDKRLRLVRTSVRACGTDHVRGERVLVHHARQRGELEDLLPAPQGDRRIVAGECDIDTDLQ